MVNSVSSPPGVVVADLGPKVAASTSTPVPASSPVPDKSTPAPDVPHHHAQKAAVPVTVSAGSTQALVPPLTSLALWRDGETGMQVSVVRDRISGQVVEKYPTDRALRLAAMARQQEHMAQELQQEEAGTPRLDLQI